MKDRGARQAFADAAQHLSVGGFSDVEAAALLVVSPAMFRQLVAEASKQTPKLCSLKCAARPLCPYCDKTLALHQRMLISSGIDKL